LEETASIAQRVVRFCLRSPSSVLEREHQNPASGWPAKRAAIRSISPSGMCSVRAAVAELAAHALARDLERSATARDEVVHRISPPSRRKLLMMSEGE
jgi:hypothetical protein